jgi:hypothetical protein
VFSLYFIYFVLFCQYISKKISAQMSHNSTVNPFYTGDGGKGISLAILAPEASGLTEDQGYIPALVQGELVSSFKGYSAISVLDRENLDAQYGELLSGYYDDYAEAGMDLGHLTPTEYIMGGKIMSLRRASPAVSLALPLFERRLVR